MSQTTTALNGCDAKIEVENSNGQMVDISGSSNKFMLDFSQKIGEYKSFGSEWFGRIACGKDAAISLQVIYTTSPTEAMAWAKDWYFNHGSEPRTIIFYLPDGASGADTYTAQVLMEKLPITSDATIADPIMCEIALKLTGEVVWAPAA